jgi:Flp pilus assembly pilin Flp
MKLFKLWKNFTTDESGAVTVDWVVLTAALVGLGILVITTISGGIETAAGNINDGLSSANNVTFPGGGTTP